MWVNLLDPRCILDDYAKAIEARRHLLVGSVNLHTAYCNKTDPSVRTFFRRADVVYVDGMPVVWWLRCLGVEAGRRHRMTLVDWLPDLLRRARDDGWRIYFLGNRPGVTAKVATDFRKRFPGLQIRAMHGHFDHGRCSEENLAVIDDINQFAPDILLVGMGIPEEQQWVIENDAKLRAHVVHVCGGTADVFAKEIPVAPRWLGRIGLEGAFRLVTQPRRLWKRYLLEPWHLIDLAARDAVRSWRMSAGTSTCASLGRSSRAGPQ